MNQAETETTSTIPLVVQKNRNVISDHRKGALQLTTNRNQGWVALKSITLQANQYYMIKTHLVSTKQTAALLAHGSVLADDLEELTVAIRRSDRLVETIVHSTSRLKGQLVLIIQPNCSNLQVNRVELVESSKPFTYHNLVSQPPAFSRIYQHVLPCIVQLVGYVNGQIGTGTGFFVTDDGYIVTAAHVATMDSIHAEFHSSTKSADGGRHLLYYATRLVGLDMRADVAVLKLVGTHKTPWLKWADSDRVLIGSTALLIGQPQGSFDFSCSKGIVRDNGVYESITAESLKLDTPLTSGNSGGPVLNDQGMCIGVVSYSSKHQNFGGALPSSIALPLVKSIIATQSNHQGRFLGVAVKTITGIDVVINPTKYQHLDHVHGMEIVKSINADLQVGDIITGLIIGDDSKVVVGAHRFHNSMFRAIHMAQTNKVTLEVLRGAKKRTIETILTRIPDSTNVMFSEWC